MLDRLIQQAISQVLTPIFDPGFSESSFGFRPGRSAHGAAKRVQQIIRQRHEYCVDVDRHGRMIIGLNLFVTVPVSRRFPWQSSRHCRSKCFDRVQHDVLMNRVSRKVHDVRLLRLIGRFLQTARGGCERA